MLHTKFHENRPAGSGEEEFLVFFKISLSVLEKKIFERFLP